MPALPRQPDNREVEFRAHGRQAVAVVADDGGRVADAGMGVLAHGDARMIAH
jgi:hypothetical protein